MATTTKRLKPTNQNITIPDLAEAPNITVITDGVGKNADAINALWDGRVFYGTSSTAAGTQAKAVTITDFPDTLTAGLMVRIKFSNNQTYNGQPQLNINSLGAVDVCRYGTTAAARYEWIAGQVVDFVYDGTNFVMVDGGIATTTYYGRTKLSDSLTSTSTVLAASANAVKLTNDKLAWKVLQSMTLDANGDYTTAITIPSGAVEIGFGVADGGIMIVVGVDIFNSKSNTWLTAGQMNQRAITYQKTASSKIGRVSVRTLTGGSAGGETYVLYYK